MSLGDLGFRFASAGYNLLLHVMVPWILLYFVWRSRREPGYRRHLRERITGKLPYTSPCDLWIHAVSLGEMRVAGQLIRARVAVGESARIQLTTTTPAGRAEAERMQAAGLPVNVRYLPLDLPWALQHLFRVLKPRALVLIETELWPNLLRASARAAVPVIVVNARLGPGLRESYRRLRVLYGPLLAGLTAVAAQSESDAVAFRDLGATRVAVSGNLKFDVAPPGPGKLQRDAFAGDWLWLAGSTHPGEEATLFETHRALGRRHPDRRLQLLVAPRHPARTPEILAQARAAGLSAIPRSQMAVGGTATDVVVLDTLGELAALYPLADAAFVGGSLVDHGGQNPLEPAAAGCPVVTGPDTRNFAHAVALLSAAQAILTVNNATGLLEALDAWVRDPQAGADMAARAAQVLETNRGATGRTLEMLEPWLHPRG
ncbi:MAG TPA: 3-deoxy-D-manno-octulosonic acid transferase [Thioalkalivibrio sp.]|nr:3-deoxy-D-manno-octulosonic acid transferase [Thioalkalivibrio sp.]